MTTKKSHLKVGARILEVESKTDAERIEIGVDGAEKETFSIAFADQGEILFRNGEKTERTFAVRDGNVVWVRHRGRTYRFEKTAAHAHSAAADNAKTAEIASPMAGRVVRVAIEKATLVEDGQVLVAVEAMKMEYQLRATFAGKVTELLCIEGQQVAHGEILVRLERGEAGS